MGNLPENYIRQGYVLKHSPTTPTRVVHDGGTGHRNGLSSNAAQVKGRTSINRVNHVVWHWQCNAVGILFDVKKCYRSMRTKTLSNVLRKILWFEDPAKESTLCTYMPVRCLYGDQVPDKVWELIARHYLAPEAERENVRTERRREPRRR